MKYLCIVILLSVPQIFAQSNEHDNMVKVSGGQCLIGNIPDGFGIDVLYSRPIYIPDFLIDKTEVTNSQYTTFLNAGNSDYYHVEMHISQDDSSRFQAVSGYEDHPVVYVSWIDAMAYSEWSDKRLPTEEEWEKTARGVSNRSGSINEVGVGNQYCWGDDTPDAGQVNFWGVEHSFLWTTPVRWFDGSIRDGRPTESNASDYGAYDMAGNVWEWTLSGYKTHTDTPPPDGIDSLRVIRGGGWSDPPENLKTTTRSYRNLHFRSAQIGFRCCVVVEE